MVFFKGDQQGNQPGSWIFGCVNFCLRPRLSGKNQGFVRASFKIENHVLEAQPGFSRSRPRFGMVFKENQKEINVGHSK